MEDMNEITRPKPLGMGYYEEVDDGGSYDLHHFLMAVTIAITTVTFHITTTTTTVMPILRNDNCSQ